jgi:hypothetical protein
MQALEQGWVICIKTQPDDMHCFTSKGDGYFSSGQIAHAIGMRRGYGSALAADFIMVCKGPEFNSVAPGP